MRVRRERIRLLKMLLIEDNPIFARSIEASLKSKAPFDVICYHASTLRDGIKRLQQFPVDLDVIVLDLSLPDSDGIATLLEVKRFSTGIPIVVLTGSDSELGCEAVKRGAQDYLQKGAIDGAQLLLSVQYAIERALFISEREDFVATLTHDLKNPLIGCDKLLELLIDGKLSWDVAAKQDLVQHIRTSNRAVISMIDNLLDVYKYDKSLAELALVNTNLVQFASKCVDEWQPVANLRGVKLLNLNDEQPIKAMVDATCMRRVFQNLIDNAIKYSTAGGVITVNVHADDRSAIVDITNPGQLLSHADLGNLFSRFWRGENRNNATGTGLGLYLCRQLIELHRGTISCRQTDDGESTVFSFEIPRSLKQAS